MDRNELKNRALTEAAKALALGGIGDDLYFAHDGGYSEWDEGASRNITEYAFRVGKIFAAYDMELEPETGELRSWYDRCGAEACGNKSISDDEAMALAREKVAIPEEMQGDYPTVTHKDQSGIKSTCVTFQLPSGRYHKAEVHINSSTGAVCGVRYRPRSESPNPPIR